jgi:hypothetical protein
MHAIRFVALAATVEMMSGSDCAQVLPVKSRLETTFILDARLHAGSRDFFSFARGKASGLDRMISLLKAEQFGTALRGLMPSIAH